MRDHLGFRRCTAHGGDLGAGVTSRLAEAPAGLTGEERIYLASVAGRQAAEGGYLHQQSTRPLSLAPALNDSPVG